MPEIEINPQLNPSKTRDWIPPERRDTAAKDASNGSLVGSFFTRAAALAIDMTALYLLAAGANHTLRAELLQLGHGAAMLAGLVCFLYFGLAAGPVGRGQTLGKYLLQLRVVDEKGQALDLPGALRRSLIMTAPLWGLLSLEGVAAGFDLTERIALAAALQVGLMLCVGFLLSNGLCVILDPLRRSAQDFASRTVVVKAQRRQEEIEQEIKRAKEGLSGFKAMHWAMLAAPPVMLLALTLPPFFRLPGIAERGERVAFEKRLKAFAGDEKFVTRKAFLDMSEMKSAAGQTGPAEGGAESPATTQAAAPKPKALKIVIDFIKYEKIQSAQAEELKRVEERMPEIAQWCVDWILAVATPAEMEEVAKKGFEKGFVEVRFSEVLDLGFSFAGRPILTFETSFSEEQMAQLGVFGRVAAEAVGAVGSPASGPAAAEADRASSATAGRGREM